ncbi:unnamed protein product [Discula destructiva]
MGQEFAAQDLSDAALGGPISFKDGHFVDAYGRTLSLRGWNISGASKVPTEPVGFTHLWDHDSFYQHRTVSFIGRPFPLSEAPLHFRRLQAWGMPLIRLLVTWESIGHAGPNPNTDLDLEYKAYLRQLIELMPQYGLKCFICAHQDVWSRFCGGSGAPGWTLEAAGLDMQAFTDTGAAYIHGQDIARRANAPPNEREPSGPFVWPSGNQKLAAATMATLFWAGDALAPQMRCYRSSSDGSGETECVSIQQFLQEACIEAFGRLADEVGSLEACIGFEPMNEPDRGLVNLGSFHKWNYNTDLHIGYFPSLLQSLALGSGYAQKVPYYVKSWPWPTRLSHQAWVDSKGRSAWLQSAGSVADVDRPRGMGQCIWRAHGVWKWDEEQQKPVVLQQDYFDYDHRPGREGSKVEWYRHCYAPFALKFAERVSTRFPTHLSFVEPLPNQFMPPWGIDEGRRLLGSKNTQTIIDLPRPRNMVHAPHFYDLNVLFSKHHGAMSVNVQGLARGMFVLRGLYFGAEGLRKNYATQLRNLVEHADKYLGKIPTVIGEVGIPYDINGCKAFATGNYDKQRELMHALISAMEDNFLCFTLWNYNPTNTAEHGDGWNDEDFSVVTASASDDSAAATGDYRNTSRECDDLYEGVRCADVVIRPYAVKIAGFSTRSSWDPRTLRFELEWQSSSARRDSRREFQTTEIFVPDYHYGGRELEIEVSDGEWELSADRQTLRVYNETCGQHRLVLKLRDVRAQLLSRVLLRRQSVPSWSLLNLFPPAVEVWTESITCERWWLLASAATLAAVFAKSSRA